LRIAPISEFSWRSQETSLTPTSGTAAINGFDIVKQPADVRRSIALDTPECLKDALGGNVVTLKAADNQAVAGELKAKFNLSPVIRYGNISFSVPRGEQFFP